MLGSAFVGKFAIGILLLFLIVPFGQAYQGGISGPIVSNGCNCHGNGEASESVVIGISGLPSTWNHSQTYNLNISTESIVDINIGQPQGGLNVMANIGSLSSVDNSTQIGNNQLTHTIGGNNVRNWSFQWHSPQSGGQELNLRIMVNTVDGDGTPDADDQWNMATFSITGPNVEQTTENGSDGHLSSRYPMVLVLIGIILTIRYFPTANSQSSKKE